MPRTADPAKQLSNVIASLQEERQACINRIAEIDALFERCGIQPQERKRPGRPPGRKPGRKPGRPKAAVAGATTAGRRKRGTFEKTATESIMGFVKDKGKEGATTAEINQHWQAEGRAGNAYITIGRLVKDRKLKKTDLKGRRGSRYTAA